MILIVIFAFIAYVFLETFSYRATLKTLNAHEKGLARDIITNKYREICLIHSYTAAYKDNIEVKNKIIDIPKNRLPSPDDIIWVIIGISNNNKNKAYAIDSEAVLKYFDNHEIQCKKL